VSPWLITSFGLAAGRQLVAALLTLGHHRIGVVLLTLGAATTIVGGRALARAHRRSTSRRRSTS
jgi:DNA-binding LacI/PurR family transcriptional regulator